MLIGCFHRELELGMESNQREMREAITGGMWQHVLDPENVIENSKLEFKTLGYIKGLIMFFFYWLTIKMPFAIKLKSLLIMSAIRRYFNQINIP